LSCRRVAGVKVAACRQVGGVGVEGAWDECGLLPFRQLHVPKLLPCCGSVDGGSSGCAGWCVPVAERERWRRQQQKDWRQRMGAAKGGCALLHHVGLFVFGCCLVCADA
ncbi:chitin-binding like protein, partial [Trypanosoma cruzi]